MRGRELLLIVNAQDRASRVLRRVAGDMRALGRVQDLQLRRQRLALQQARTTTQRMRAARELAAIETGSRRMALDKAKLTNLQRMISLQNKLTNSNRLSAAQMAGLGGMMKREAATTGQLAQRQKELGLRANEVRRQLSQLAMTQAIQTRQQNDLNNAIRAARWEKFGTLSRLLGHFGRVAQLSGLVAGAGIAYAANAAANFRESVTKVATQTGPVGTGMVRIAKNAKFLGDQFLTLAKDSTSSFEQINEAGYDLFSTVDQLGTSQKGLAEGTKIMKLVSDAAVGGMTDMETVMNGVVASLSAFREIEPTGKNVRAMLNRMFAAVRFGRMNFAEFASVLGTIAPAARAAGQSFDIMAGTVAFLSKPLGVNKAAVGFARLSEIFSRGKFLEGMEKAGVTITDAKDRLLPFPVVIERIAKAFPKLKRGGGEITRFFKDMSGTEGTIQARRAFVFLIQQLDQYRSTLKKTVTDNNEFDRSLDAMEKTTGVRWKKFMNELRVLFIQLGDAATPALLEILEPIQKLAKWFDNLDDSTKKNIGRFAAWTAALLLVGGTLATVLGGVMAFTAALGRVGGLFKFSAVLILAAVAALKLFKGEWNSLRDVLSGTADILFGSWQGFIAGVVLATAAIKRLTVAWVALRGAMLISAGGRAGALAAGGGMLPMMFGTGRDIRRMPSILSRFKSMQTAGGASKFGATMKTAAAAAVLLPGPLKIAAGAIAAMGIGALIWKKHSEDAAEAAAKAATELQRMERMRIAPFKDALDVGQIGATTRTFARSRLDFKDLQARVRQLRGDLKGLRGEELAQGRRDLQRAILDRADAYDQLNRSYNQMISKRQAVGGFFNTQATLLADMASKRAAIVEVSHAIFEVMNRPGGVGKGLVMFKGQLVHVTQLQAMLRSLNAEMEKNRLAQSKAAGAFNAGMGRTIRSLMTTGVLPKGGKNVIGMITDFAKEVGRMPTLKEMKTLIKVGIQPDFKTINKMPQLIQNFLAKQKVKKVKTRIQVEINHIRATKGEGIAGPGADLLKGKGMVLKSKMDIIARTQGAMKKAQDLAADIGKKKPKVQVGANDSTARDTVRALQDWINSREATVKVGVTKTETTISQVVNQAAQAARNEAETTRQTVSAFAAQSARASVNYVMATRNAFFSVIRESIVEAQSLLSVFDDVEERLDKIREKNKGAKLTPSILAASFRESMGNVIRFGNAMYRLTKRNLPQTLLDQLAELGPEGAQYVAMLANMTKKQLNNFIRMWNRAQAVLRRNANSMRAIVARLTAEAQAGADGLAAMYDEFRDTLEGIFGTLGEKLLNQEFRRRFTATSLIEDLRKQLDAFKNYQDALNNLIGKNVPFELIQQLMALGPEGLPYLKALVGMTDAELKEYIDLWKEVQKQIDAEAKKLMKAQIKEWKKHGKAIAAGIIAGLISEREGLMKFFRNMFRDLLRGARGQLKANSPSKVYEQLGRDVMTGFQMGLNSKPNLSLRPGLPRTGMATGGGAFEYHQHIYGAKDETLGTTLERARFRMENRR